MAHISTGFMYNAPKNANEGDMFFDNLSNIMYTYNTGNWVKLIQRYKTGKLTGIKIGTFNYIISGAVENQNRNNDIGVMIKINEKFEFKIIASLYEFSKEKYNMSELSCTFENDISNIDHTAIVKELEDLFTLERLGSL